MIYFIIMYGGLYWGRIRREKNNFIINLGNLFYSYCDVIFLIFFDVFLISRGNKLWIIVFSGLVCLCVFFIFKIIVKIYILI